MERRSRPRPLRKLPAKPHPSPSKRRVVERDVRESSPEGAPELSPALQRGVEWNDDASPGRTTDVLRHAIAMLVRTLLSVLSVRARPCQIPCGSPALLDWRYL